MSEVLEANGHYRFTFVVAKICPHRWKAANPVEFCPNGFIYDDKFL